MFYSGGSGVSDLHVGIVNVSRIMGGRVRSQLPQGTEISSLYSHENIAERCKETAVDLLFYEVADAVVTAKTISVWHQVAQYESVALILILRDPTPELQLRAMRCGVTDILIDTPQLEKEVQGIAELRQRELGQNHKQEMAIRSFGEAAVTIRGKRVTLTRTEYHILRLLIDRMGSFVTTQTLTERVWGANSFERKEDLYVYIARLREKLEEIPSKPKLIMSSRGFGYVFLGEVVLDRNFA